MNRRVFSNKNQEIPKQKKKKKTLRVAFPVTIFFCNKLKNFKKYINYVENSKKMTNVFGTSCFQ